MRLIDADRLMGDFLCTFYNDLDDQNRTEKLINEAPTVERPHGMWIDYTDDGYVECPFCGSATNCEDGGKEDLHYCFSCGASMGVNQNEL